MQARKEWLNICKVKYNLSSKVIIHIEGNIQTFQDKQKLKEIMVTKAAQQEILKKFQMEKKGLN